MFYFVMTGICFILAIVCIFYPKIIRHFNAAIPEEQQRSTNNLARSVSIACFIIFVALGLISLNKALTEQPLEKPAVLEQSTVEQSINNSLSQ